MTCLTDVPLAPSAQVVVAGAAACPEAAKAANVAGAAKTADVAEVLPAGTASMPSARVPPPTTASSPADRWARRATGVLRRAGPAGPFVSLVAAMGDYLHLHRTMVRRRAKRRPWSEPAEKIIRPDEYPQVERRAGDHEATPPRRPGPGRRPAAAALSIALPRNFRETDIRVRCITEHNVVR